MLDIVYCIVDLKFGLSGGEFVGEKRTKPNSGEIIGVGIEFLVHAPGRVNFCFAEMQQQDEVGAERAAGTNE